MQHKVRLKPRKLKLTTKQYLFTEALRQRKVPRELLADRLIRELEESGEIPPTLETAKRYISAARNANDPIDQPWTLGACREYASYFPPDSLPFLVKCIQEHKHDLSVIPEETRNFYEAVRGTNIFTIRFCIWIVRLKPILEYLFPEEISRDEDFLQNIILRFADAYSLAEMSVELLAKAQYHSFEMDDALFSRNLNHPALVAFPLHLDKTPIRVYLEKGLHKEDNK